MSILAVHFLLVVMAAVLSNMQLAVMTNSISVVQQDLCDCNVNGLVAD